MKHKKQTSNGRRKFLQSTATVAAGASLTAFSWSGIRGANQDIRLAVVGLNGKGRDHFRSFSAMPGVRVVAVCDVDTAVLDRAVATAANAGIKLDTAVDLRDLLQRDDIDAISIATPNHLHSLQAIWSMEAGKDVLLEKPASHNLWEGAQVVAAAKKYNRIVQVNLQNRSSTAIAEAIEWAKAGNLGELKLVRGIVYKRRTSIGKVSGPVTPPQTVNYDLFMGPAPLSPLRRKNFHYDWHWQWETGNGDIIAQGNHQLDIGRRFLGDPVQPSGVLSLGGRFGYDDDGETPNSFLAQYNYNVPFIFEVRGLPSKPDAYSGNNAGPSGLGAAAKLAATMDTYKGINVGNVMEYEGGYMVVPKGKYDIAQAFDRDGKLVKEFKGTKNHYANFIDAVRNRDKSMINATILQGHLSASLAHLANTSYLTGKKVGSDVIRTQLKNNNGLTDAFDRFMEHLEANKVKLKNTPATLGAALELDVKKEVYIGENSDIANSMRSREYRKPFVVPQFT